MVRPAASKTDASKPASQPGTDSRVVREIGDTIESLSTEKFTGEVVFRLSFNQGGIRNSRVIIEKPL